MSQQAVALENGPSSGRFYGSILYAAFIPVRRTAPALEARTKACSPLDAEQALIQGSDKKTLDFGKWRNAEETWETYKRAINALSQQVETFAGKKHPEKNHRQRQADVQPSDRRASQG